MYSHLILHVGTCFHFFPLPMMFILMTLRFIDSFENAELMTGDPLSTDSRHMWLQQLELNQDKVGSLELHPGFPRGLRDSSSWAIFYCFLRHISRELDWKLSSQHMNQCPYGDVGIASDNLTCCATTGLLNYFTKVISAMLLFHKVFLQF